MCFTNTMHKTNSVTLPTKAVFAGDNTRGGTPELYSYSGIGYRHGSGESRPMKAPGTVFADYVDYSIVPSRNSRANLLYFDGHAGDVTIDDIMQTVDGWNMGKGTFYKTGIRQ